MVISDIWSILAGPDADQVSGTHCTFVLHDAAASLDSLTGNCENPASRPPHFSSVRAEFTKLPEWKRLLCSRLFKLSFKFSLF